MAKRRLAELFQSWVEPVSVHQRRSGHRGHDRVESIEESRTNHSKLRSSGNCHDQLRLQSRLQLRGFTSTGVQFSQKPFQQPWQLQFPNPNLRILNNAPAVHPILKQQSKMAQDEVCCSHNHPDKQSLRICSAALKL